MEERTKFEAMLELDYNVRLHQLHERLNRRAHLAVAFLSLAAGSAAAASGLAKLPGGVLFAGTVVAALTIADAVFGFARNAARHETCARDYNRLKVRAAPMTLDQIDAELSAVAGDEPPVIDSLRAVAWNDTLSSSGAEHSMRPELRMQRLMRALA